MKKLSLILFSLLIFFFTLSNPAFSDTKIISYPAVIAMATDGDSIRFEKERIRLFGIDAPELEQTCKDKFNKPYACGEEAKFELNKYLFFAGQLKLKIYCYYSERDKYNRILGECFVGKTKDLSINALMVLYGQAIAYLRYSDKYLDHQKAAKGMKMGLWQGDFDIPEEWRRKNK